MPRDEFTAATRNTIAGRAGYRCANPTCARLTSRPDPVNPQAAISDAIAAHITAAAQGGPRFDAGLSPEQRASAENGIWLCATCSRVIDSSPDAYPKEALQAWKRYSEQRAVREASVKVDEIAQLIAKIDEAYVALSRHCAEARMKHAQISQQFSWDNRSVYDALSDEETATRRAGYQQDVAPLVVPIVVAARAILGEVQLVRTLAGEASSAHVNVLATESLGTKLLELRAALTLR